MRYTYPPYFGAIVMLEMRPGCECCDVDLPADSEEAMICSFECTFCRSCVTEVLKGVCLNCGGGFKQRPARVGESLVRNPASSRRVLKEDGCKGLA